MKKTIKYSVIAWFVGVVIWGSTRFNKHVIQTWAKEVVKSECLK